MNKTELGIWVIAMLFSGIGMTLVKEFEYRFLKVGESKEFEK